MAETGSGRPAFYLYFKDLCDMLRTLLEETRETIFLGASPWFTSQHDPPEALRNDQHQVRGLIPPMDAFSVATAHSCMDAGVVIKEFGTIHCADAHQVLASLWEILLSTLYGSP